MVIPVAPPSIQGVSSFGGFQMEILDLGAATSTELAEVTQQVAGAGNQSGRVAGLFSAFTANDPQLVVTIDRDKARSLGLPIREVTDALAVLLGSQYVNDFDFNNRAYRVYVQGDQQFRAKPTDLSQYYARASNGDMVPLSAVVRTTETTAPAVINHFNLFRSTEITGSALPGVSSGQAMQEMERIARETLPQGYDFAWAGLSLEETKSGNQAAYLFALSIVLVYLVLAAQYESWVLPFIILLGVPLAVFGALSAQLDSRILERRVLPGRPRHADRAGGEELDPDRRVRRTAARAGAIDCRCRCRSGSHPAAADSDDVVRVHPRRAAARLCDRRGRGRAKLGRHGGRGRHAGVDVPVDHLHSGALRDYSNDRSGQDSPRLTGETGTEVQSVRLMFRTTISRVVALFAATLPAIAQTPPAMEVGDARAGGRARAEEQPDRGAGGQGILRAEGLLQQTRSAAMPFVNAPHSSA